MPTTLVWKNIKPPAIQYMDGVRQRRLKDEYDNLVLARKRCAADFLRRYKNGFLPQVDIFPEPPDFCEFEPVKQILTKPVDVNVDVSSFDVLLPTLPELINRWREDTVRYGIRDVLLNSETAFLTEPGDFTPPDYSGHPASVRHKASLATTVFTCTNCSGSSSRDPIADFFGMGAYNDSDEYDTSDSEDFFAPLGFRRRRPVKPLFYPEVLAHPCLTRFSLRNEYLYMHLMAFASAHKRDPSTYLENCLKQRQKWKHEHLQMDTKAGKVAEQIVKLAGLDPETATTFDMDNLDARFRCKDCESIQIIRASGSRTVPQLSPSPESSGAHSDEDEEMHAPDLSIGPTPVYPVMTWRSAVRPSLE